MEEGSIEIKPASVVFDILNLKSILNIQNLTLHFIMVKLISPNP